MISFLFPTRDRPGHVARTLATLGELPAAALAATGGGEVIVVDNASTPPAVTPRTLANGMPVHRLRRETNDGAAARNHGAAIARGDWLLMLDDDSAPRDAAFLACLDDVEDDVAAIGGAITLPGGAREAGGLPEVFVGCGALVRRDAFLAAGGYDPAFGFYAEEYDLCAKLIAGGWRIVHDLRLHIQHDKTVAGRDFNDIVRRLVRNNGWVLQRYAPAEHRESLREAMVERYRRIAERENAMRGFEAGRGELERTLADQSTTPLTPDRFDRFLGLVAVRKTLGDARREIEDAAVAVVDAGKHDWVVRQVVGALGGTMVDPAGANLRVIGTLSPGPMLDAFARRRDGVVPVLLPWMPRGTYAASKAVSA